MHGAEVTLTVGVDNDGFLLLAHDKDGHGAAILMDRATALTLADEITLTVEREEQS